jgi:hypothetical protein
MADELIRLNSGTRTVRVFMLLTLLGALAWVVFAVRWYVGNTMAEYLDPEQSSVELVRRTISLAPGDPLTHWHLGQFLQKQLPPEHLGEAIREYEIAVGLAPNDYRLWLSLGTALEQHRELERAEKVLRRAVDLAPSYSYPAWYLGNLLLRSGRYAEAFAELRRAAESDPQLRPQLFNLAWEVYNTDSESMKTVVGPTAEARGHFAQFLMEHKRFDDGLRIWQSLNQEEKLANSSVAKVVTNDLLGAHRFHDALVVWNDLTNRAHAAEIGRVIDGSFEESQAPVDTTFGWQVKAIPQLQIGIDPNVGHNGPRSLRLTFQVDSRLDRINVSQLVPVQPGTEYDFECFVKTKNLTSVATPFIQIVDAVNGSVLASTTETTLGENEQWQRLKATFKSGDQSQAVIIRVSRTPCPENSVCPIYGSVWYDDFSLARRS